MWMLRQYCVKNSDPELVIVLGIRMLLIYEIYSGH